MSRERVEDLEAGAGAGAGDGARNFDCDKQRVASNANHAAVQGCDFPLKCIITLYNPKKFQAVLYMVLCINRIYLDQPMDTYLPTCPISI